MTILGQKLEIASVELREDADLHTASINVGNHECCIEVHGEGELEARYRAEEIIYAIKQMESTNE